MNYFITIKGIATIAAIESGLLPEVDGGWDDTAFQIFWERLEYLIAENYSIKPLSKRKNKRKNR